MLYLFVRVFVFEAAISFVVIVSSHMIYQIYYMIDMYDVMMENLGIFETCGAI